MSTATMIALMYGALTGVCGFYLGWFFKEIFNKRELSVELNLTETQYVVSRNAIVVYDEEYTDVQWYDIEELNKRIRSKKYGKTKR